MTDLSGDSFLKLPPDTRSRLLELEERRDRVCLRRTALPVAFGVVGVLAVALLGDEIFGTSQGTAAYAWMVFFWVGSIIGLSVNEITARRCMKKIQGEFQALLTPSEATDDE